MTGEDCQPCSRSPFGVELPHAESGERGRGVRDHGYARCQRAFYTIAGLILLIGSAGKAWLPAIRQTPTLANGLGKSRRETRSLLETPAVAGDINVPTRNADQTRPYMDWGGNGGRFGLEADWRVAVREKRGQARVKGNGIRGRACMAEEKRQQVREILAKRRVPLGKQHVAACLRTKDYGRYLPEWLAYHYAIGVDEVSVYDDDSVDNTTKILQPFIEAGLVRYVYDPIRGFVFEMEPLNRCLNHYMERKKNDPENAPSWLLFHDTDEYLFPVDTNITILEGLQKHSSTCCVLVNRIQFGSSGYARTPQGLVMDNFVTHQKFKSPRVNPKVMVNLEPTETESVLPPLPSMHNAHGCLCHGLKEPEMRINHYLGSFGDHMARFGHYWQSRQAQVGNDQQIRDRFISRDLNDETSDTVTHWSCATREILYRVAQGLDLVSGI